MRGQDLLEQRRARAWEPDDEDGLAARMAPPRAAGEELRGTDLDLLLRVAFDQLGPVAAFGAFELVTQPVVVERARKVSLVFIRLAECKAQMVAVDEPDRRSDHRGPHPCQLLRRETVGLEVGEAPVRITEVRPRGGRATVGIDRGFRLPERLLRVTDRQVRLGIRGVPNQQLAVEPDRALVLAETDTGRRKQGLQRRVLRLIPQELPELAARFLIA